MIEQPPSGLSADLIARCLEASEQIRLHRNASYSNPVSLATASSTVVFLPVRDGERGVLVVPFRFGASSFEVRGSLILRKTRPLPIYVLVPDGFESIEKLWAAVLLGYEVVSVLPFRERGGPASISSPTVSTGRPGRTPRRGSTEIASPRRVSPFLTAIGRAAVAHWVVGHVRDLPEGQRCSEDKLHEARQVGIELAPGQTWVRPHARGFDPQEALTFRWTVPAVAADIL